MIEFFASMVVNKSSNDPSLIGIIVIGVVLFGAYVIIRLLGSNKRERELVLSFLNEK